MNRESHPPRDGDNHCCCPWGPGRRGWGLPAGTALARLTLSVRGSTQTPELQPHDAVENLGERLGVGGCSRRGPGSGRLTGLAAGPLPSKGQSEMPPRPGARVRQERACRMPPATAPGSRSGHRESQRGLGRPAGASGERGCRCTWGGAPRTSLQWSAQVPRSPVGWMSDASPSHSQVSPGQSVAVSCIMCVTTPGVGRRGPWNRAGPGGSAAPTHKMKTRKAAPLDCWCSPANHGPSCHPDFPPSATCFERPQTTTSRVHLVARHLTSFKGIRIRLHLSGRRDRFCSAPRCPSSCQQGRSTMVLLKMLLPPEMAAVWALLNL